jgi:hypothetical protein
VIRKVIQLAILLLMANAVYRIVPVALHYYKFKDAVQELALFSQKATDAQLLDRVMVLADENNVPLEREWVQIQRYDGRLTIDVSYVESMKVLPGYDYVRQFDIEAKAFDAR